MNKPDEIKCTRRFPKNKTQLITGLKRIEGQVRGIQNMIEDERYCVDILTQISAINSAMKNVAINLLEKNAQHCMSNAIKEGNGDEVIEELIDVFKRFSKS
ncbi:metal-sensing transcriptional repressor [Priestia filamentosa]|uniref:metal-sensing transcriptional repressor n=1 Tax=Priestia filamentosa TaxID=1402861 RepID=UPI00397E6831